ncbi:MAG TPA: hypothetical protein DCS89_17340 [Gammaproteobacteria bacterium]|nr:hypothetical protein [Gammaproteobacteria bacterium]HAT28783.1 hypothetical protein [Gammaproteobacteria bacterium]
MDQRFFKKAHKIKGYTLIELLVALGILGALLALALPGFQDVIESSNTNRQAKNFWVSLNLARSEAIKRGINVSICASNNATDCNVNTWSAGWIVFVDNNGDADGAVGSIDAGDIVIRVFQTAGAGSTHTFTVNLFSYDNLGFGAIGGVQTFLICPATNNAANARSIEIGASGRGRRIDTGLVCP